MAKVQISDITRAVKDREKAVALNEVADLARRLNLLADAIANKPAPVSVGQGKSGTERILETA